MIRLEGTLGGRPVAVLAPEDDADLAGFRDAFPGGQLYGLDVEGTYLTDLAQFDPDFRVRTVQFGTEDYAWVLRLRFPAQLAAARELLLDESVSFCSHSNMDVLSVATRLGVDITGRNVDTLMLARMADPDKDKDRDLKTLTAAYLGPELGGAQDELDTRFRAIWTGRKNAARAAVQAHGWARIPDDDPTYLLYAGMDAVADRRLAPLLTAATQAPAELVRVEQFLASRANRIQIRGLRVDREALEALSAEATGIVTEAKAGFMELADGVNPMGPKALGWYGQHGVDWDDWLGARTDTGNPSLAKENLALVGYFDLDEVGRAAFDQHVRMRGHQDLKVKTDGVKAALDRYGRIHPVLHPMGASTTARMSSAGPNVQNFSKKDPRCRGLFLPEEGHVLVTIDFEQVELRVVAALAREEKMVETIFAGGDLHQLTVDELAAAGVTITRDTAKIVNFLIVYGGSGKALHQQTGIPLVEAQGIVATWRSRYPAISALAQYMGGFSESIRTVSGRRLPVTVNRKTGGLRAYANINYLVQSSARELLVDAWLRFDREFGRGPCVWYPIHDELVLQVPEGDVAAVVADAERAMRFDFRGVPISATAVELRDEDGVSRWMTSKRAEKIAAGRAAVAA